MKIEDNQVLIYIDDKPIACTTGATLDTTTLNLESFDAPALCAAVPEWNITVSGKWPELTRLEALKFEYYCARRMPRKKKKSYRKQLVKAMAYEVYRENVHKFLSREGRSRVSGDCLQTALSKIFVR